MHVAEPQLELAGCLRWLVRDQVDDAADGTGAVEGRAPRRFAVESLPRSVLLDRQGRQIATDLRGEALLAVLASLFPEPGPDSGAGGSAGL